MKPTGSLVFWICLIFSWVSTPSLQAGTAFNDPHFVWGAAWSAHQAEGWEGGGEGSDWAAFESTGSQSPIEGGSTSRVAIDHWNRYPEDLSLAKELGVGAVRTSISWAKIEPSPGLFNEAVLEHYRNELLLMREKGLVPMIALHHFAHPKWFHEQGGWLSDEGPKHFLRFATKVVDRLGDLCDLWIPFNEPMVLVVMGYLKGEVPPQLKGLDHAFSAAFQIARAHRMVTAMIHEKQGLSPSARGLDGKLRGVGLANSFNLYTPYRSQHPKDREAARVVADLNNWAFLKGILSDRLRFEIPSEIPGGKVFERAFPKGDVASWHEAGPFFDWMGVNYYRHYRIQYQPKSEIRAEWIQASTAFGKADYDFALDPAGLETVLRETAREFPLLPIVVTENGIPDAKDKKRPEFLRQSLQALDRAKNGKFPLDIRGYYHWSLFDNFEWLQGYGPRFGLIEIQYEAGLKRVPRPSFFSYRDEISARRGPQ